MILTVELYHVNAILIFVLKFWGLFSIIFGKYEMKQNWKISYSDKCFLLIFGLKSAGMKLLPGICVSYNSPNLKSTGKIYNNNKNNICVSLPECPLSLLNFTN
jgi:hypothetical protein